MSLSPQVRTLSAVFVGVDKLNIRNHPRASFWTWALVLLLTLGVMPAARAVDPNVGPGGPILVVTSTASNFGKYYAEILRTEGFNSFAVADISTVTSTTLASYDTVILSKMALTSGQVTTLTNWVTAGGNLIAMAPDTQLATLLGVTAAGSTLSDKYLAIDTGTSIGTGIVSQTMQYHGAATLFTLNGASKLATLYATATAVTSNPAVTLRSVGSNGGQAAMFAYDLATSIIYTRQGNPAWNGQDRDGQFPVRSDDLFFGASATDPQANYVDLTKVAIPQADEQQRFLANLITSMTLDKKPLPRFWYFPNNYKAAVIMTGDDHGTYFGNTTGGATANRFDTFSLFSPSGCSVNDWQCIRGTSYVFDTSALTAAQATAYTAQGFEVATHINTGLSSSDDCHNFTAASLATTYTTQINSWKAHYPGLPVPVTVRHHCIVWSDWASAAKVQIANGIRLDTDYYYWPPGWVNNVPGHFTGSAMPMRFADTDGTMIDVFQAVTQMTDESGQEYPFTVDTLLDRAVGSDEQYGAYTVNAHTDYVNTPASDAVLNSAIARGVPIVSAKQMLTWLDGRNASSFGAMTWSSNALSFTVTQGSGATGLRGLIPRYSTNGTLSSITRGGSAVSFTLLTIKGVQYASFPATAGNYVASYEVDTTPPTIATRVPATSATEVSTLAPIKITFSEALNVASVTGSTIELRNSSNALVAATVTYDAPTLTATLTPSAPLTAAATYTVTVHGGSAEPTIRDTAGNAFAANVSWSFTTWTSPVCNPCSFWDNSVVPTVTAANDPGSVELGVKFRTAAEGYITGIRFYKGSSNTGTHVGNLWTATGSLLGTVNFQNETAEGWQTATFSTPIAVTANTVYVASYFAPGGNYSVDGAYFTNGFDKSLLHALTEAESGGNGVYSYNGTSAFPTQTYNSANYWVDVVFNGTAGADTVAPTVTGKSPDAGATNVSTSTLVAVTFSEAMLDSSINTSTVFLKNPSNVVVPATVAYSAVTRTASVTPSAPLAASTVYTVTVKGGSAGAKDASSNPVSSDVTWTFTTTAPLTCASCSIWPTTAAPSVLADEEVAALQLGVKFKSDVAGTITGIRFYKSSANTGTHVGTLWTSTGTLLGNVTFNNETESGWQQALFATPIAITAGTTYVAAYSAPEGHYSSDSAYFTTSKDNGALHALADAAAGGNGVYAYGSSSTFPGQSYNASNYWVDVVFSSTATDTAAPVVTITSPTTNATTTTTSSSITIGGTATDNFGIQKISWSNSTGGSGTVAAGPSFSIPGITLQVGANAITVTAYDYAGNSSTDTITVTYNIGEQVPPTVTITSPTSAATYTTGTSTLALGGTASDNVGVTSVSWTNSLGGSGTATGTTTWAIAGVTLQSGLNTITVTASDAVGNLGSDTIAVTYTPNVDTTPPTVAQITPTNGQTNVVLATPITVTFNEALTASTVSTSTIELRNAANVLVPATVSYNAASLTATLQPTAALAASTTYNVRVHGGTTDPRVKDVAGNALVADYTWTFTTGTATNPCSINAITAENCLTGNLPTEWDVDGAGDVTIQGFATNISVNRGTTVQFKIDTNASAYTIDIYRMGYYGGRGARKITSITPSATLPQIQDDCVNQASTGLIDCGNWLVSASWPVPSTATSGIYFARLRRTDTGGASHIFFIVRDDSSTSKMVFQTSDTTWQAYNNYGGNSLYLGSPGTNPGRAYKVSYNRPFNTRAVDGGQDWVFNAEYPMVRFLEANGYDLSYISGVDTDRFGSLLLNHKVFLSVGHDEYWSGNQRANVEAARAAGVHLAFFSGNEVFWKTRYENSIDPSNTSYRTLVAYKETHAGGKIDPTATWTGTWRDPRFSPPADGGKPENALTGTLFMVNDGATGAIQVPAADGKMRIWRGTPIASQASGGTYEFPFGTLGYEWDIDAWNSVRPAGLIRLSTTTVSGAPSLTDYGSTYVPQTQTHALTLYKASSGALVFGAGTIQWSWGLDQNHDRGNEQADLNMQQATVNLFADMGVPANTLQTGLFAATQSTDTTAPTATITQPAAGGTVQINSPISISGTALDAPGGVVGGVEVSVDGGTTWRPATGRETWAFNWTPTALGSVTIKARAIDDSGNIQSAVSTITVTVATTVPVNCPCSLFSGGATPTVLEDEETSALQLGVKFRSDLNGTITGVRFYKSEGNVGTHVGTLWTSAGSLLGSATFGSESTSGWQTATFSSPITITANTTYVVAYTAPNGRYSSDSLYFANGSIDTGPLHALSESASGGNGVYAYGGPSTFPTASYNSSNYWVDVVFAPSASQDTTAPTVAYTAPTTGATFSTSAATLALAGTSADAVGVTSVTWTNSAGGNGTATGTTSWSVASVGLTLGTNTITVFAKDAAGNTGSKVLTVTRVAPDTTNPTVTITSPTSASTTSVTTATVSLGGTASDNTAVSSVTWSNALGGSGTATGTTTWTASNIPLQLGLNSITVTATDSAGNTSTDTIGVTYSLPPDTTKPTITITSPTSGTSTSTSANTITIGGTASDNVGVTQVTWVSSIGVSGTATGTTTWSAASIPVINGTQTVTVTARDAAGNTNTDALTVFSTTAADTSNPVVTITSPTTATTATVTADTVTLGGTASDNRQVKSVTWVNNRGGTGTATGTTSWTTAAITLQPGSNLLTVTATDLSNRTSTDTITVTFNAPITYGQVAAYSFNEGTGSSVADASGNNNLGTVTAGSWTTSGKFGNSLVFNGTSTRVFIGSSTSLNLTAGMTVMAWVYPTANQTGNRTIIRRETNGYWLYSGRTTGTMRPYGGAVVGSGTETVTAPTALALNTWSHVAVTYDGATVSLYVNGTLVSTNGASGSIVSGTTPLYIGGTASSTDYFQGRIDEVRVYNRALSSTELATIRNTAITP